MWPGTSTPPLVYLDIGTHGIDQPRLFYNYFKINKIILAEQKVYKRRCHCTKEQLLINKLDMQNSKAKKNLSVTWINYK